MRIRRPCLSLAIAVSVVACTTGPDYQRPAVQIPESFKEGAEWQRAQAAPQASISNTWWRDYRDERLSQLVDQSVQANQSIAAAEAAYRVALATVQTSRANLFPVLTAGLSGVREGAGGGVPVTSSGGPGQINLFTASTSASWEPDLWGSVRRSIESAKAGAQASDAQLAGQRLSIATSIALDYFALRQADADVESLKQQQDIDSRILEMTRASFLQAQASSNDVLVAQDVLEQVVADLQSSETSREQYEHAIAVLIGVPPAAFSLPPDPAYVFVTPDVPLALPSQLLERRYDVVTAERNAAAANARIGVAEAAFFPSLTLSAEGGFERTTLARLFSLPSRFWTLGPDLAGTIFDGGARDAAVQSARATYDEDVALYRNTVLTAFQNVEDSLSSVNHLRRVTQSYANILQRNRQLFSSEQAQLQAGIASQQDVLNQQLTLLQAEQNLKDSQAQLTQGSVTLIRNLGGGWQWDASANAPASAQAEPVAGGPALQAAAIAPPH